MAAGLNATLSKQDVDRTCGGVAQALNRVMRDVGSSKDFLDVYQDAELEAIGYSPADVATLRSAMADLDQLRRVYEGLEDAPLKDYRTFAQRIWGVGFVP